MTAGLSSSIRRWMFDVPPSLHYGATCECLPRRSLRRRRVGCLLEDSSDLRFETSHISRFTSYLWLTHVLRSPFSVFRLATVRIATILRADVSGAISRSSSQPLGRLRRGPCGNSGWRQTQPLDLVHISSDRRPWSFVDGAGLRHSGSR